MTVRAFPTGSASPLPTLSGQASTPRRPGRDGRPSCDHVARSHRSIRRRRTAATARTAVSNSSKRPSSSRADSLKHGTITVTLPVRAVVIGDRSAQYDRPGRTRPRTDSHREAAASALRTAVIVRGEQRPAVPADRPRSTRSDPRRTCRSRSSPFCTARGASRRRTARRRRRPADRMLSIDAVGTGRGEYAPVVGEGGVVGGEQLLVRRDAHDDEAVGSEVLLDEGCERARRRRRRVPGRRASEITSARSVGCSVGERQVGGLGGERRRGRRRV